MVVAMGKEPEESHPEVFRREVSPQELRTIFRRSGLSSPQELRRVGEGLIDLADALSPLGDYARTPLHTDASLTLDDRLANFAQALYRARRRRVKNFSESLFSDPAWDMLLDLFVHAVRNQRITISSLCIAGAAPSSTSLRWIGVLVAEGLVERVPASYDQRVTEVRLTKAGYQAMRSCLTDSLSITEI